MLATPPSGRWGRSLLINLTLPHEQHVEFFGETTVNAAIEMGSHNNNLLRVGGRLGGEQAVNSTLSRSEQRIDEHNNQLKH